MSLKNVETDDLVSRWGMIIDAYLLDLKKLREDIVKIDKVRNELLLIREELMSRNVVIAKEEKDIGS